MLIVVFNHEGQLLHQLASLLNLKLNHLPPRYEEVSLDQVDIGERQGEAIHGLNALDAEVPPVQMRILKDGVKLFLTLNFVFSILLYEDAVVDYRVFQPYVGHVQAGADGVEALLVACGCSEDRRFVFRLDEGSTPLNQKVELFDFVSCLPEELTFLRMPRFKTTSDEAQQPFILDFI